MNATPSRFRRILLLVAVAMTICAGGLMSGCATQRDSDQPWNATQPWEGTYNIPGLSNN